MTRDPLQRCKHFVPGLRSVPWWSPSDVPAAAVLESHSDAIADEFADLVLCGRLRLHPQSDGGPDRSLTDGDWNIFELWCHERPNLGNLVDAPVTADIIRALGDTTGNPRGHAYFSVLQPGVHVRAHCGPTNTRIRLHLGIRVPAGAEIRVGTESRTWEEGKCLVFDDSWEHEATNRSDRLRAVLLVDIWHPDLTRPQREALDRPSEAPVPSGGERGWLRRAAESSVPTEDPDPVDPAIFRALGPERAARITEAARKVCRLDFPFVAAAARRVQEAIVVARHEEATSERSHVVLTTDEGIWGELAELAGNSADHGLGELELIDVAHICSLWWRADSGRTETMAAYQDTWLPADKAALADGLAALETAQRMFSALAEHRDVDAVPPFGALVPVLCAAHRRSAAAVR